MYFDIERRSFALRSWLVMRRRLHLIWSTLSSCTLLQNPVASRWIQSSQCAIAVSQRLKVLRCKISDSKSWFSALFAIERLTVDLVSPVQPSILRKVAMSTSCKEGGSLRLPDAVGVATAPVSCLLAECLGGEPAAEIAVCDPTGEQGCAPEEDAAVSCLSLCRFEGASEAESFREPSML